VSSIHNALLRGPVSRAVKAALGVGEGGDAGVERFGETLTPVFDLWGLPEWAYLRDEDLLGGNIFQAAGAAGLFSQGALQNRALSDRLVVVEKVFTTETVRLRIADAAAITTVGFLEGGTTLRRDTRKGAGTVIARGGAILAVAAVALPGSIIRAGRVGANFEAVSVVLAPGDALVVANITSAADLTVSFEWRERLRFPGER